jgi:hypothetical protein
VAILFGAVRLGATAVCLPLVALAESDDLKLVDTGWLTDSRHGEGVAMIVVTGALLERGPSGFDEIGQNVCNAFAPYVVPYVLEQTGKTEPAFIALTVRQGTDNLGVYWREFYEFVDGKCGDPL